MKFIIIKKFVLFIPIVLLITGCSLNGYKLDEDNKTIIIRTDGQNFACQVPVKWDGIYEKNNLNGDWIQQISLFDKKISLSIDVIKNLNEYKRANLTSLNYVMLTCEYYLNILNNKLTNEFTFQEITTRKNEKIQIAKIFVNQDSISGLPIYKKHMILAIAYQNLGYRIYLSVLNYKQDDDIIFDEFINSIDVYDE